METDDLKKQIKKLQKGNKELVDSLKNSVDALNYVAEAISVAQKGSSFWMIMYSEMVDKYGTLTEPKKADWQNGQ